MKTKEPLKFYLAYVVINSMNSNLIKKLGLGVLIVILYFGVTVYVKKNETSLSNNEDTNNNTDQTAPVNLGEYKNGTYTADGEYISPDGAEKIGVTLTLTNDTVTNASVEVKSESPTSKNFQTQFSQNFKVFVIGKDISNLNLSKISGSSLTPKGFNNAVEKIKSQAK